MEVLKSMIRQFYQVLFLSLCLLFLLQIFFGEGIEGERDIFTAVAHVYEPMMEDETWQCNGLSYIENEVSDEVPEVIYAAGAQQAGTNLVFKSTLNVRKADGTVVSGTREDDFSICLLDIKTIEGESVLEILSTSQIENLGEIPAPFIYDKATDRLYLYSGGVYLVQVKIYGSGGGQAVYEFWLPVESV